MTTKSQEVFIQTQQVYASLKSCKPELTNFFFHAGIEYGRNQALEDVTNGFIKQKSWTQDYAHAVVQHAADEGVLK